MQANKHNSKFRASLIAGIALLLSAAATVAWLGAGRNFSNLWRTPDQQGQALMRSKDYAAAADKFSTAMLRGVALYKDGQFENALKVFNSVASPEGIYNRANCQVMLGKYDAAIKLYERALKQNPAWKEAAENRDLAIARKALMAPPDDDAGGTGGQLEADEIVFDDRAKNSKNEEVIEAGAGEQLSDDEMRALWLRKVQTQPAEFLRNKFAYQLQFGESKQQEEGK
ncbi:MAG: tetratricopeptide repeat protein [Verrucomicrobiota bacterium]